jgi:hypothetical protein
LLPDIASKGARMIPEKRRKVRRKVSYYIPVAEAGTSRLLGVLMDISPGGFRIDSREQVPSGNVNNFYIDLPNDIAPRPDRMFTGRSRWCRHDQIDPSIYYVGYEFVNVSDGNAAFFQRLYEKYGSQSADSRRNTDDDYLWK